MKRRAFIAGVAAAAAMPLAVRAQERERVRRIAVLTGAAGQDDDDMPARNAAFVQGLQQAGWVEGRNVQITSRFPKGIRKSCAKASGRLLRLRPMSSSQAGPPRWRRCFRRCKPCRSCS